MFIFQIFDRQDHSPLFWVLFHEAPHDTGCLNEHLAGPVPISKRIVVTIIPCARDHLKRGIKNVHKAKLKHESAELETFSMCSSKYLCTSPTTRKDYAAPGVDSVHPSFPRLAGATTKCRGPGQDKIWLQNIKRFKTLPQLKMLSHVTLFAVSSLLLLELLS